MTLRYFAFRTAVRCCLAVVALAALLVTDIMPAFAVGGTTGTVSGTVVDASGAPVPNAQVNLAAATGSYRALTSANGHFTFTGVVTDTYTLSVTKPGSETLTQAGITVSGDQTVTLNNLRLGRALKIIGTARANSASSAYQPSQTQDAFTFSGQQVTEALGKTFATNQTQLIASSPGTQIDRNGNLSVRGALATETGLNFDGIDYTQVDHGGSTNIFLNGIASVTVNPGAGDATQGSTGAGVINLIPKRGTHPAFGLLDLEAAGPYFNHQLGFEYGWASPNNRFSNYASFTGSNFDQPYGPHGYTLQQVQATAVGRSGLSYASSTYPYVGQLAQRNQDVVDNFVYRFGTDNNKSIQALYQTHWDREYGGIGGVQYGYGDASAFALDNVILADPAYQPLASRFGPLSGSQTEANYYGPAPTSQINNSQDLIKLEYNQNFGPSTFLALRYYQVNQENAIFDPNGTFSTIPLNRAGADELDGGQRNGAIAELTHQFAKHNVTLGLKYELQRGSFAFPDTIGALIPAFGASATAYSFWQDFALPVNTAAPLTFGGANDCPVTGGCWLYYLNSTKTFPNGSANPDFNFFKNGVPRIPPNLLASPDSRPQAYAVALRDQLAINTKLNLDYGVRFEGTNYHLPSGATTGDPGPDKDTNSPTEWEPRLALSYQLGSDNAVRASYGRSAEFQTLGVLSTPLDFNYYLKAYPNAVTSLPGSAGTDALGFAGPTFNGAPTYGHGCGSGEAGLNGFPFRPCTSYADTIRWSEDYFYPDNGFARTSTYNNYDLSFSHRFTTGWSAKVTPFYRRGQNIIFYGVVAFTIDPATGAENPLSFRPVYTGFTQSTGAELYLTTPQRPFGMSGFVSATYDNAFSNRPAGSPGEDTQPTISDAALKANNAYRVGFLSPFVANVGVQYKTRNGFRINPVFRYDRGFPFGSGNTTPIVINGQPVNVTSTNITNQVPVISSSSNDAVNYIDPTNPGTALRPNIYATRGTAETSAPGGALTKPRLFTDLTFEYSPVGTKTTFGLQVTNIFNLFYSEPIINTRYAPLATGVSTYQTGQTSPANPANGNFSLYAPYGISNYTSLQYGSSPYVLYPNRAPVGYRAYFQLAL